VTRFAACAALLVLTGCGNPQPASSDGQRDRASLKRIVNDCDSGKRQQDCDRDRQAMATERRDARLAAYQSAH
jgi:hypothetical protein